jgi:HEPN domain-containing protein
MRDELREQVARWLSEGEYDLRTAQGNLEMGAHKTAALLAQQAAEKSLKALALAATEVAPPRTHDLPMLLQHLNPPEAVREAAWSLTPEYLTMRYPDATGFVGYELYDEEVSQRRLAEARTIIAWVTEELSRHGYSPGA